MAFVRIKLSSTDLNELNRVVNAIKEIVKQTGVKMRGPIPLPTKVLRVPVMRITGHRGTKVWETWQMRIHRRIIDIAVDERTLKMLMKIPISEKIQLQMKIIKNKTL